MNNQTEVIFHILPLLSTIEEGLRHIQKQLIELRYEEAFYLLEDAVEGIASIDHALELIKVEFMELEDEKLKKIKTNLNQHIAKIVSLYENKNYNELEKTMNLVLDSFTVWREYIETIIRIKIVS